MQYMYVGRKLKKRDMRQLWITRVNNAGREHGVTYTQLITGLVQSNVVLNRKLLSELAMHEPRSFKSLAELAKQQHEKASSGLKLLLDEKHGGSSKK